VDTERKPIAGGGYCIEQPIECARAVPHHMQDRSEYFFRQFARVAQFKDVGRDKVPLWRVAGEVHAGLRFQLGDMCIELLLGLSVDHRPYMGCRIARVGECHRFFDGML